MGELLNLPSTISHTPQKGRGRGLWLWRRGRGRLAPAARAPCPTPRSWIATHHQARPPSPQPTAKPSNHPNQLPDKTCRQDLQQQQQQQQQASKYNPHPCTAHTGARLDLGSWAELGRVKRIIRPTFCPINLQQSYNPTYFNPPYFLGHIKGKK